MKILSINIGQPKMVNWQTKNISTAIFKNPVLGSQSASFTSILGDGQADLKHHGGTEKALYAYDVAYYNEWKKILDRTDWEYGLFGENLTTEGLTDDLVKIGAIYQAGTVVFQAIQPRIPCFKLNLRFANPDVLSIFYERQYYGTYYRVLQEGQFQPGDSIQLINESSCSLSIKDLSECYATKGKSKALLQQILEEPMISDEIKKSFSRFIK